MSANTRMQPLGHTDPASAPPAGTKTSPEIGSTATECAPLEVGMSWVRFGTAALKSITPKTRDVATAAFVSPVAKHRLVVGSHHTSSPPVSCANWATIEPFPPLAFGSKTRTGPEPQTTVSRAPEATARPVGPQEPTPKAPRS